MKLSHVDDAGKANMVDVANKSVSQRVATAQGFVSMNDAALLAIEEQNNKKGDVLSVARVAGIMAAKQTANIIPLCHTLALSKVSVDFIIGDEHGETRGKPSGVLVNAMAKCSGQTGVEMEALVAVNVACLTLFDMCKALDPAMIIGNVRVVSKEGGKTNRWQHPLDE